MDHLKDKLNYFTPDAYELVHVHVLKRIANVPSNGSNGIKTAPRVSAAGHKNDAGYK